MANSDSPSNDSLNNQLNELNNRSRWYSTQLWAVPFAYLGVSSVAIFGVLDKAEKYLWSVFLVCALLGAFVIWHMFKIKDGEKRAVENLIEIENLLKLNPSAEYKDYIIPFFVAVWIFVIGFAIAGVYLLCKHICVET